MGWAHPAVAMEEVLGLVRGFVDVLVLAGGRTSSGSAATWSSDEVKKALRWALFFEEVFKDLRDSGQYEHSANELDAALVDLTSSPEFPKGLADVRSETLSMASMLVIRHFLKPKTMSVENFGALLEAVVEMDIDGICAGGVHTACQEYVKSILDMDLPSLTRTTNTCDVGLPTSSDELYAQSMPMGYSWILVKEFLKGLDSASCTSLAERGLEILLNSVKKNSSDDARNKLCAPSIPKTSQMIDEFVLWKQWRAKCLSYLLDERTVRIVSGARLIFRAPKEQWMRVFEPLKGSTESCQSDLVEIMYADLHQLLQGASRDKCQEKLIDLEEKDILEYARQSLQSKPYIFWLLPPVLTAAVTPPGSTLFEIYLAEIDKQFHEAAPANQKCNCRGDQIEQHHSCEIAERIQCLYTFHIQQPRLVVM
ncbi:uncharacterized protein LOC133920943 isoform X2 [Phragmites australis]|uniref:uncharacterized protein LOC133920943 isoform X2 n=1 Tax=Phragmites australis TaxID=29695 RepID=UPI002D791A99|nr:uncharacterized protein LOC133920943 isoform X2 [Phragmites australis]